MQARLKIGSPSLAAKLGAERRIFIEGREADVIAISCTDDGSVWAWPINRELVNELRESARRPPLR